MSFRKLLIVFCLSVAINNVYSQTNSNDTIESYLVNNTHSPTKATIFSSLLPGLGQVYNKQAWKIPIIYTAGGAVAYFAITNYQGAQKFKREFIARENNTPTNPDLINFPDQSVYNLYYAYQKNFELSMIVGAAVYLLNIVDAMVYAHLFYYDISDKLSLKIQPYCAPNLTPSGHSNTLGLSMRFDIK